MTLRNLYTHARARHDQRGFNTMCAMAAGLWMIIGSFFGAVCGFLAIPRNRSAVPWWFLGTASGPVALIALLRMGTRTGPKALL